MKGTVYFTDEYSEKLRGRGEGGGGMTGTWGGNDSWKSSRFEGVYITRLNGMGGMDANGLRLMAGLQGRKRLSRQRVVQVDMERRGEGCWIGCAEYMG
jgi:hypothetical protein